MPANRLLVDRKQSLHGIAVAGFFLPFADP